MRLLDLKMGLTGACGRLLFALRFEYFYGFAGGDANQWQPNLFRNTTQIYPFEGKPGWNLITGMAESIKIQNGYPPQSPTSSLPGKSCSRYSLISNGIFSI